MRGRESDSSIRPISSLFSADGSLAVSPTDDARIGNVITGKMIPFSGRGAPYSMADNGKLIALSANDGTHVWNIGENREVFSTQGSFAAISPDGKYLATQDTNSGLIWLWDVARRQQQTILCPFLRRNPVLPEFSPDGRFLAWLGFENTIHVWDTQAQKERDSFEGAIGANFSPDGKYLRVGHKCT